MLRRMQSKIDGAADRLAIVDHHPFEGADTLIVAYGITSRAAGTALHELKRRGRPASILFLKTLWPVPEAAIRKAAGGVKRILVVEMNLGQYVREIERILPGKEVSFCGQMDGRPIAPETIVEAVIHG
jgi:2-oxoglutarate/2-oxoacid ferredoxin oxidoreductase subunit alpha